MSLIYAGSDTTPLATESNFDYERTDSFSGSTWIYLTNAGSVIGLILSKQVNSAPFRGIEWGVVESSRRVRLVLRNDNSPANQLVVETTNALALNTWKHVAFTYDGTSLPGGVSFYIDAAVEVNVTVSNTLSATILNNDSMYIGSRADADHWLYAYLTELAVFDSELSANDINKLYRSRVKYLPLEMGAKTYFPMDDGASGSSGNGDTVRDYSGNGSDGTNTGTTWLGEQMLSYPASSKVPNFNIAAAIMNQFQGPNLGADLYNGTLL
jgi:hypothetical protein